MVYLNKMINIDMKELEMVLLEKMSNIIEHDLYYINEINENQKEIIKNNMIKEIKKEIKNDNFIFRIMAKDRCTFKHNRGKHDGSFCHKHITNNGDKINYLCTIHNKNRITKKKIKYNLSEKTISINKSIKMINNINKSDILFKKKINNNKLINKNIYIKGFNMKRFKNCLRLYNNIIYKDKEDHIYTLKQYRNDNFKYLNNIKNNSYLYNNNYSNFIMDVY